MTFVVQAIDKFPFPCGNTIRIAAKSTYHDYIKHNKS